MWGAIALSYVFYLSGTLYLVSAAVGWLLFALVLLRAWVTGRFANLAYVPVLVWLWVLAMLVMLLALFVAHSDYSLGTAQVIKSSIGWAKGWALFALFLVLGALACVRGHIIVHACCLLAMQALVFAPLGLLVFLAGLDGALYVSPLKALGGPISTFEVNLFGLNPETGGARWSFFAPWAPAAGLLSCLLLALCQGEQDARLRLWAGVGALTMCLLCQSRAGWAIFIGLLPALLCFKHILQPMAALLLSIVLCALLLFGLPVLEWVLVGYQDIKDSRPDSTRVRQALADIALQRWQAEAPIWGHGIVEDGPKMVEHMPIGSHHNWYGLLFVKGLVGALAFAIPLALTCFYLMLICPHSQASQRALLIVLILVGYSFFENLEILIYLFWPAWLWLGMVLNPFTLAQLDQPH